MTKYLFKTNIPVPTQNKNKNPINTFLIFVCTKDQNIL